LSLPERMREMFDRLLSDVRYVARTTAKQPLFSALVVLTLACGIGATTAVYTLVEAVLLRPLPFADADRLVVGFGSFPLNDSASVSPPDYLDYRDRVDAFEALAAIGSGVGEASVGGVGSPEVVPARTASHQLFDALGVTLARGRVFTAEEAVAGGPHVVVISDGLWKRRFGADPDVIGSELLIDEEPATVIGVLPADFELFAPVDIWAPLPFGGEDMSVRRFHFLRVIGKLRAGVDAAAAQAEVDAVATELEAAYPDSNTGWTMRLVPLRQVVVGDVQQPLLLLLAAVGAVLLIACCNVAILLLARAARRAPEISMRHALGASGGRIVRLLLTESLLLALAGGTLGVLLAYRGVDLLVALSATALPRLEDVSVDGSVLLFSLVVTIGTGLLFGLAPALRSARGDADGALRAGRGIVSPGGRRLRGVLVSGQVALSFALLVGAGLLIRSFDAMTQVEPGYTVDGIATASIDLPSARYDTPERRHAFFDDLFARLTAMPAIDAVGGVNVVPQTGGGDTFAYPEGSPPEPGSQGFNAQVRTVTPGYFNAIGIPLLRGRAFTASDSGERQVVILDEPFASTIFPDGDAVGRTIVVDFGEPTPVEVVGVVGGVLHWDPTLGRYGTMYFPFRRGSSLALVLRAAGDPAPAIAGLRTALAELDPMLPLANVTTMADLVAGSVAEPRFRARLMGAFALAALILAVAGLYGVLAFFVAERRRDIGVRLALGAGAGEVVRLVVGQGLRLVAFGLAFGVPAAAAVSWTVRGMLFGVTPADPLSFLGVAAALAIVALLACLWPARRATRVDPLEVMRTE
ncbi:MAG: ABC transporter permease, partial [Acidobacteriota bacterium]